MRKYTYLSVLIVFIFCVSTSAQKRFHISILGNPNLFLFLPTNSSTTGISLLPELEFSYDLNENLNTRIFASVLSTDVSNLISTNSSNNLATVNSIRTVNTNLIALGGFSFRLSKPDKDNEDGITLPILNSFSIGVGYGNAFVGKNDFQEDVYKEGVIIMVGFKIRVVSFNIGRDN